MVEEMHQKLAQGWREPVIFEITQGGPGDKLAVFKDHGLHRQLVHNGRDRVGETDIIWGWRLDAIENLDALDGVQPIGGVAGLDIRHPRCGTHP